jgi:hypothetical protein
MRGCAQLRVPGWQLTGGLRTGCCSRIHASCLQRSDKGDYTESFDPNAPAPPSTSFKPRVPSPATAVETQAQPAPRLGPGQTDIGNGIRCACHLSNCLDVFAGTACLLRLQRLCLLCCAA